MRRADRLFQLIQLLRRRRVVTAAYLAHRLEVSERTVYRDVRDLMRSGVPIQGEAGVGYSLSRSFDLPPLMFTEDEIEALVLGARVVRSWADPALAGAAGDALDKIETVLPAHLKERVASSALFALNFDQTDETTDALAVLRAAVRDRTKVRFAYERGDGTPSSRTVRPLSLSFVAPRWWLSGWCELREDFRTFRVDRMSDLAALDERFASEPGRTLADFLARVHEET